MRRVERARRDVTIRALRAEARLKSVEIERDHYKAYTEYTRARRAANSRNARSRRLPSK
jgi:hypothetical protein